MPMENGKDRNATWEDYEVDQIGEAMDDGHPNVIEHDGKPKWLFLDRGIGRGDFDGELLAEPNVSRLVPRECFLDVGLGRFPNEQARH
jgi:hypothetical protein